MTSNETLRGARNITSRKTSELSHTFSEWLHAANLPGPQEGSCEKAQEKVRINAGLL